MKVKLKEEQLKLLGEGYQNSFSFEELSSIGNEKMRYEYCVKHLGNPIGEGSSRVVFTLTDNHVLKLAFKNQYFSNLANGVGEKQNEQEFSLYNEFNTPILPKVLYCDKNYHYIVCENVLPAEPEDFEKILGIPFYHWYKQNSTGNETIGFNKYFKNIKKENELYNEVSVLDVLEYLESNYAVDEPMYDEKIEYLIHSTTWFKELEEFVSESGISDYSDIENFGMVNRNGKEMIVLLDTGLNLNTWYKYYTNNIEKEHANFMLQFQQ